MARRILPRHRGSCEERYIERVIDRREFITTTLGAAGIAVTGLVDAPAPFPPLPAPRQLAWHDLEFYGFVHFTVNTFTNREWGDGDESPTVFNPTDFDADQIVGAAKEGGMKGLILTCKHHDGFCLWPSRYTEHSVKHSPFRRDAVKEISEACGRQGLRFGVYLSPWDRNHKDYGTPEYLVYYRNQLRELLTEYGPVFEIFFDGANGGDGYYGGAYERREIDNRSYYEWPNTWQLVRELQPNTVLFSDAGPDIRYQPRGGRARHREQLAREWARPAIRRRECARWQPDHVLGNGRRGEDAEPRARFWSADNLQRRAHPGIPAPRPTRRGSRR